MASMTVKNLPDDLLDRLRARAARDRRSLNQELIHLLDRALLEPAERNRSGNFEPMDSSGPPEAERQLRAWSALAGRWESDLAPAEEIESILRARSPGREVEL